MTRADWRQLVAGQAVVPGILGAAAYLIVAAVHSGHEMPWIFVVLGLGAAELGFSFGVAAHYLSRRQSANTVLSNVLFIGAGVGLLVFWMVRMILFVGAPPLVLVQGLGVGYAVVHVAGRHPRRWAKAHGSLQMHIPGSDKWAKQCCELNSRRSPLGVRSRSTASRSPSIHPSIHVLLGPNGAGKTTLIRALLGLIPIDAGRVRCCGATRHGGRCRVAVSAQKTRLSMSTSRYASFWPWR